MQESIIGSTYRLGHAPGRDGGIVATITGRAWVTAETTLIFDPADPYVGGIRQARGQTP